MTIPQWNSLPSEVVSYESRSGFKKQLESKHTAQAHHHKSSLLCPSIDVFTVMCDILVGSGSGCGYKQLVKLHQRYHRIKLGKIYRGGHLYQDQQALVGTVTCSQYIWTLILQILRTQIQLTRGTPGVPGLADVFNILGQNILQFRTKQYI